MDVQTCKECGQEIINKPDLYDEESSVSEHFGGEPQGKKSSYTGAIVILVLLSPLIISFFADRIPSTKPSPANTETFRTQEVINADYIEQLHREVASLDEYKVDDHLASKDSIILGVALFNAWAMIVNKGNMLSLNEEETALLEEFKSKLSDIQTKAFPKLRDSYGPALRAFLWENNISAKTFGSGYRVIEFVGGTFASNRNIKEFQVNMSDILLQMRFKQSRYKWYNKASEYTYYDMDSHDDSALIMWLKNGVFREVE